MEIRELVVNLFCRLSLRLGKGLKFCFLRKPVGSFKEKLLKNFVDLFCEIWLRFKKGFWERVLVKKDRKELRSNFFQI